MQVGRYRFAESPVEGEFSSFYKFFEGTKLWLRGPRQWWQKKGYFLMVEQAFY